MTRLGLRPYRAGDEPPARSVPVSVIVLTLNEEPNIRRCLASVAWADQVVVVDAGSSDDTVKLALDADAEVVEQPWLGFAAQREFALGLPNLRYDWVYFVDADEWVSEWLAAEIAACLKEPGCLGFAHRVRVVFMGTWIRHCGWYKGFWVVRLIDRRHASWDENPVNERIRVRGRIGRLDNDLVDEDRKGVAAWLNKHVRYAQLEAGRRTRPTPPLPARVRAIWRREDSRPLARAVVKDVIYPYVPAKSAALFFYMYVARLGFLDGVAGLRFCVLHAWFEVAVAALRTEAATRGRPDERNEPGPQDRR
jgi:glycosyltransferase involved in cell wall biosynthesis